MHGKVSLRFPQAGPHARIATDFPSELFALISVRIGNFVTKN
jgi:hypothetical protein